MVNMRKVMGLLVGDEQLEHLQIDPASVSKWMSMMLEEEHCMSHGRFLAALKQVCWLRGYPNQHSFSPRGLKTHCYDFRQTLPHQAARTTYYLITSQPPQFHKANLADLHPDGIPAPHVLGGHLAVVVSRGSCNHCSQPVSQHTERIRGRLRMKVHSLCGKHRQIQEKGKKKAGNRSHSESDEGPTEPQQTVPSPFSELADRLADIRAQRKKPTNPTKPTKSDQPGNSLPPAEGPSSLSAGAGTNDDTGDSGVSGNDEPWQDGGSLNNGPTSVATRGGGVSYEGEGITLEMEQELLDDIVPSGGIDIGWPFTQGDRLFFLQEEMRINTTERHNLMLAQDLAMASEDIDNDDYDFDFEFQEGELDGMEVLGAVELDASIGQISSDLLADPMDAQQTMTQEQMHAFVDGLPSLPHRH